MCTSTTTLYAFAIALLFEVTAAVKCAAPALSLPLPTANSSAPFPLTPNNTLVAALYSASQAPSTSWSLSNTSLCLGCIDNSAFTSTFHTFKPADRSSNATLPCDLQISVEQLYWYPKSGIEGTFLVKKGFEACVDPGVQFLVLPEEVRSGFEKATERQVKEEADDHIVLEGKPGTDAGILNFRLEGDLVVNVTVSGAGDAEGGTGEWEVPIGKGGHGAYGAEVPTLGKPFTDRVVLKWDSDAQEYGLANINEQKSKEDIKPLGCDAFPEQKKSSSTTSTATIVGTVVGGFIGGVVFALAGMWFFRRGEKGVKSKYEPMRSQETLPMSTIPGDRRTMDSIWSSAPSIRSGFSSQGRVSPMPPPMEPQMVEDSALYEAPEGGTAYPSKRATQRTEMGIPSIYQR